VRGAAAVVAMTAIATLALVAIGLSQTGRRSAGTNSVKLNAFVAAIPPGKALCQNGEVLPASAGALELYTGTFHGPGPALRLSVDGRPAGGRAGGYPQGWRSIPLSGGARDRREPAAGVRICIQNAGRRRVALGGQVGAVDAFETFAKVGGKATRGRVTMRWSAAHATSWWGQAATVARRVTFGKADLGPWAPAILFAIVWIGASVVAVRSVRA
jgi:hypothetical protein